MPDKKTLLYDAFLGLVRQGGNPADITVGAIAARAGIGKGTVYDYFPAKEALFSYSLSRYAHELVDGLRASCTEGDFRTRFYVMLDFAAEQFDKNQLLFQLCFLSDAPLLPCGPYRQELCENLERAKAVFWLPWPHCASKAGQKGFWAVLSPLQISALLSSPSQGHLACICLPSRTIPFSLHWNLLRISAMISL